MYVHVSLSLVIQLHSVPQHVFCSICINAEVKCLTTCFACLAFSYCMSFICYMFVLMPVQCCHAQCFVKKDVA